MSELALSLFSFREELGPAVLEIPNDDGSIERIEMTFPRKLSIAGLPARIRKRWGTTLLEVVAFQFASPLDPQIATLAAALRSSGSCLLNVSIDVGDLVDSTRADAGVERVKAYIDAFRIATPRFFRTRAHWPNARVDAAGPPPPRLVRSLRELADYAGAGGSKLLIENLGGASSDPAWIELLVAEVGPDRLGLVLDLGNFDPLIRVRRGGGDPPRDDELESIYDAIERLVPLTEIVHLKVLTIDAAGTLGPLDMPRVLDIYERAGYRGPLTLEYEEVVGDPWGRVDHAIRAIRSHRLLDFS